MPTKGDVRGSISRRLLQPQQSKTPNDPVFILQCPPRTSITTTTSISISIITTRTKSIIRSIPRPPKCEIHIILTRTTLVRCSFFHKLNNILTFINLGTREEVRLTNVVIQSFKIILVPVLRFGGRNKHAFKR